MCFRRSLGQSFIQNHLAVQMLQYANPVFDPNSTWQNLLTLPFELASGSSEVTSQALSWAPQFRQSGPATFSLFSSSIPYPSPFEDEKLHKRPVNSPVPTVVFLDPRLHLRP